MKRLDNRTVELTEAEMVVLELFRTLLDMGLNQEQSIQQIRDNVPEDSLTRRILDGRDFQELLLDEYTDITSIDARIVTH